MSCINKPGRTVIHGLQPLDFPMVFRVISIVTERNLPGSLHTISTWASSYCTPLCEFFLTENGIGEPNCHALLLVTHTGPANEPHAMDVIFEYDRGRYTGRLKIRKHVVSWMDGATIFSRLCNVSSL